MGPSFIRDMGSSRFSPFSTDMFQFALTLVEILWGEPVTALYSKVPFVSYLS
jgi:hypothetical protein